MPYQHASAELRDLIVASEKNAQHHLRKQQMGGALIAIVFGAISAFSVVTLLQKSSLSVEFNRNETATDKLYISTAEDKARLKGAEETIAQQKKEIEQLQQKLREAHVAVPAPTPVSRILMRLPIQD